MTLKSDIAIDTAIFFDNNEFAVQATYTPFGGVATAINVLFDEDTPVQNPETGTIEGVSPQISVRASDVPNIGHKDIFVIDSITYLAVPPFMDLEGVKEIRLIKQ